MQLGELVRRYLELAGRYGQPVPLSAFGLPRQQLERILSRFDEDYHISRYLQFHRTEAAEAFLINGFPQTHLSIEQGIEALLS